VARISVTAALLIVLASVASAQAVPVSGRVFDQTGAVLPGVTIDVVAGESRLTATSDGEGRYAFESIPPGRAELTYRLLNFSVARRTIHVNGASFLVPDVVLALSLTADVVVTGSRTFRNIVDAPDPAENLVGLASSASQGAVTASQLAMRPLLRTGEVLETVPGLVISQHSGAGKANQYYLRGFNLDHGSDFATTVAGVPVNTPSGAHAHGYSDLGFLIPELVSGVQFSKGPYAASEGDFAAAGSANINYVNWLDAPRVDVSTGAGGWHRLFGAASPRLGSGFLLGAIELNHDDGPWVRPDGYHKINGVLRYSRGDTRNGISVTGMSYQADWRSTDQIPARAIDAGLISRRGLLDASDGGTAERQSLASEFQRTRGDSSWRASAFVLRNRLDLFSNFTYFLDDPHNGDQFEQAEHRLATGGRLTFRQLGRLFDRHTESAIGIQIRDDRLAPVGLYRTAARRRLATTREDRVTQRMTSVHAQTETEWSRRVRTTVGMRADLYQFSVRSDNRDNSGAGSQSLVSPKFGAAFGPWAGTELYVNAGMGFHSNDARGAVTRVDPVSGASIDPVTPLVRASGAELGLRTARWNHLQSTVALWYLDFDSELLFVGDAGTTAAGRPSRRHGIEWANYARVRDWLTVDGEVALSRSQFRDADPAGRSIPGSIDRVVAAGLTLQPRGFVSGSLRVRHVGPRPLVEDARVNSASSTLWSGEVGYTVSSRARLVFDCFNVFNERASDVEYFYTSRLPGEPAGGVDDLHLHPAVPRTVRLGIHMSF
jgi:hypothetical protein